MYDIAGNIQQIAIAGFICFLVGGAFGWFLGRKFKEIKNRISEDLNPLLDRLENKMEELKKELEKYKKK